MVVQGDGPPPDRGTFDRATVDRWQVFGGMAGVAGLLLSVVGGIQDQVPLSLVAAGVVTLVGVWLLYRWGRRPRQQLTKHFVVPVLLTVVGAATGGVLGGLELRPTPGTGQPAATTTTTTVAAKAGGSPSTPTEEPTTGATTTRTTTTVVPAPPVGGQVRAGQVTMNYDYSIDLDSTTDENGGVTAKSTQRTDLKYEGGFRATPIVLVAEKLAEAPPTYQECAAATAVDDYIEGDAVVQGASFCVKTTEGRWAGLVVVDVESYNKVKFDLVVWEKQA
ncbi:hypothetical protein FHX81_6670 [Saccharothrix saharensis]|uniref:Uncharacterized protein n=1 Tax=Saccharothrix saharensis TaxID=571190 RepID=A0A543JN19_9PSEU|nr:hypothetical protein [Saccharothrix saharensis]TQM84230.1 hypothetical protein FHX81_6670 [Saccharothrix saharensis]